MHRVCPRLMNGHVLAKAQELHRDGVSLLHVLLPIMALVLDSTKLMLACPKSLGCSMATRSPYVLLLVHPCQLQDCVSVCMRACARQRERESHTSAELTLGKFAGPLQALKVNLQDLFASVQGKVNELMTPADHNTNANGDSSSHSGQATPTSRPTSRILRRRASFVRSTLKGNTFGLQLLGSVQTL